MIKGRYDIRIGRIYVIFNPTLLSYKAGNERMNEWMISHFVP